ncbi:MAG TPA: hypothetical protein VFZ33_17695 [Chitinophagaceae bacterium]
MKRRNHVLILFLFFLTALISCAKYKQELDLDWKRLNSKDFTVKYLQHNFNNFPTDSTMFLKVSDFAESPDLVTLDSVDVATLVQLISDSTNYSDGDCGTFALNAGIIVYKNGKIRGLISIGCGFNQWEFEPFNRDTKSGGLNDTGFQKMSDMLDEIYYKNKKLQPTF